MSQLQSLRTAASLHDVAALLRFKPKALAFILYRKPEATKYRAFTISKRRGGRREINAPSPELKLLQRRLADLLQDCIDEINSARKTEDELAHEFKRRRSIISNAMKHRKRQHVFNIDIQDFFPSINFGRVRGFFLKDANFLLHRSVATILAQIACHNNGLPQGSPCSPVISNLIAHVLDIRLCRLASRNGCTYSRYADDITFSTNKPDFPTCIAERVPGQQHEWNVGDQLENVVTSAGFAINSDKTRMQYRSSRQEVTGLVVNKKVNIRTEYRRTVRAMAKRLFMTGHYELVRPVPDATGALTPTKIEGTIAQLHGKFGHIHSVDRHNSELEAKGKVGKEEARRRLRSKEKLYRRFLLFKDFYVASAPVIVCEGKTDNVYLYHAIRSLASHYPKLATIAPSGSITINVRIFKTQSRTGRILELGGGSSETDRFIGEYLTEMKSFKADGLEHPVILVVDNDSGADKIFARISKILKKTASRTGAFVHVFGNLYVVATPVEREGTGSEIEDFLPDTVRTVKLGGKTFSTDSKADSTLHFGKAILASHVRENASKIDFTGFTSILDRITAAIEDYETKRATATVVSTVPEAI